jgi:D-3-phosphoglycerate dehydrogenase
MISWRVLITCPQLLRTIDEHRQRLDKDGVELLLPDVIQQLSEDELMRLLPGVDGIVVGDDPLTRRVLESADRLRVISKWGVGIDNIDTSAASELGMTVTNTPGMFGDEVADVVTGYLVMLARHLHTIDREVRAGTWAKPEGSSLAGRTLGIVGLGHIGRAVGKRARAMGMRVIGTDVAQASVEAARQADIEATDVATVLREADVLSLNCPLTTENRHMLNATSLASMKHGAWIINTARGGLVDEGALVAALGSGQVAAAALDVFETEPLPDSSPLRAFDQVILGAHNASNTAEAVTRTSVAALDNLLSHLVTGERQ